jgi:hypothetical protein
VGEAGDGSSVWLGWGSRIGDGGVGANENWG